MSATKMNRKISKVRLLLAPVVVFLLATSAYATAPGITGPSFDLTAQAAYITQPEGSMVYSWGYGCNNNTAAGFLPQPGGQDLSNANCPLMQ